jgi:hypothetical protein
MKKMHAMAKIGTRQLNNANTYRTRMTIRNRFSSSDDIDKYYFY